MPDGFAGHVVFCELLQQFAGQNEIKKIVHVRHERRVGCRLPRATPKKCEDLCIGQQWAVAVSELRMGGGDDPRGSVKRHNAQRMLILGARMPRILRFLARGSWGHETLLAAAQMVGLGREHAESRTLARCGGHVNSTKKEIARRNGKNCKLRGPQSSYDEIPSKSTTHERSTHRRNRDAAQQARDVAPGDPGSLDSSWRQRDYRRHDNAGGKRARSADFFGDESETGRANFRAKPRRSRGQGMSR